MTLQRLEPGDLAPDIELVDSAGAPWRLGEQRGRQLVLIFHRHIH